MALITPQAACCDGLWLSVHTDDRNRYCWGRVRFCRRSPARRSCSLSRHSNYCWHFRGCCQLSFLSLFIFFPISSLFLVYCHWALFSTESLGTFYDSTWHDFFLSFFLSVLFHTSQSVVRFSCVIFFCRILIFRSASYQVQWNWYWLLIRITQSDFSSLLCRPELPACRSVTI